MGDFDLTEVNKLAKNFRDTNNDNELKELQNSFLDQCLEAKDAGQIKGVDCAQEAQNLGLPVVEIGKPEQK